MKNIFLLAFVVTVFLVKENTAEGRPPTKAPSNLSLKLKDGPKLEVSWQPLKDEIVTGYKVKVWEVPPTLVYKYEKENGVEKLHAEIMDSKKMTFLTQETLSSITPIEIKTGPNETKALVKNGLQLDKQYEIRVLAFNGDLDGPMSSPIAIKI